MEKKTTQSSETYQRGFYHLSRAWYAAPNMKSMREHNKDFVDEVMFGIYCTEGGTRGEMKMHWRKLAGNIVPQLQVFDDGWAILNGFLDVIDKLAEVDSQNITPEEFCILLVGCGFTDMTPEESPYKDKPAPKQEN